MALRRATKARSWADAGNNPHTDVPKTIPYGCPQALDSARCRAVGFRIPKTGGFRSLFSVHPIASHMVGPGHCRYGSTVFEGPSPDFLDRRFLRRIRSTPAPAGMTFQSTGSSPDKRAARPFGHESLVCVSGAEPATERSDRLALVPTTESPSDEDFGSRVAGADLHSGRPMK